MAMAPHSSILAWKIPWTEEPGRLQSLGSWRVGHVWVTSLSFFTYMHWRRKGNPLQCSCLENPRDSGAWWAAIYGVEQSWTRLKRLSSSSSSSSSRRLPRSAGEVEWWDNPGEEISLLFSHSVVSDSLQPHGLHQASMSFTIFRSLLKLMSIELVMPSNHLILCRSLLLLASIFPRIRVFSNESALHIKWPKYWSFSFSISPSSEYWGLSSFRIDWFDLLAVQGTLKSLLQHHRRGDKEFQT